MRASWVAIVTLMSSAALTACGSGNETGSAATSGGQGGSTSVTTTTTTSSGMGGSDAVVCGDGVIGAGEVCDDGNTEIDDGCDASCAIETGYACDGEPSVCAAVCGDGAILGAEACDDGNADAGDGCDDTCAVETGYLCDGEPSACDAICGDGVIVGGEACDDSNTAAGDGCDDTCAIETGYDCAAEPSACAPICGDGLLIATEACDDAGVEAGDGCDDLCAIEAGYACGGEPSVCAEICGDSLIVGVEQCDDAGVVAGDGCDDLCAIEIGYACAGEPSTCGPVCGDGMILGGEACDDMGAMAGDGCSDLCAIEAGYGCTGEPSACATICGDGLIVAAEACDDMGTAGGDGCSSVCAIEDGYGCMGAPSACATICGDGKIVGAEACDDMGTAAADGCSATCTIETGYACNGAPSACAAICGDGMIVGIEACDDFNLVDTDGCSATCTVTTGWACNSEPSLCAAICGDGMTLGAETCDDQNAITTDGCSACVQAPGYTCSGAPSTCVTTCGDGVLVGTEACDDGNLNDNDCCSSACAVEAGCEIEPNDTIAIANDFYALAITNKVKANIGVSGDLDYFAVTVPVGSTGVLTAETKDGALGSTCGSLAIDSAISIFDANGVALDTDDDGGAGYCSLASASSLAPGTYYVMAQSSPTYAPTDTYDYAVDVTLVLATCGNNIVEAGEFCDDGGILPNDGCSATCGFECITEVESNDTYSSATALGATPTYACGGINPGSDLDYYSFTLTATSDVFIETFDASGVTCSGPDTEIYLYDTDGVTLLANADQGGLSNCSRIDGSYPGALGLPPGTYYVHVEDWLVNTIIPAYTMLVKTTATCGDSVVEGSEECEGISATCDASCQRVPVCGDGFIDGTEECDDSNVADLDGCSALCIVEHPAPLAGESICNDGFDDDSDGMIDCADADCALGCAITPCAAGQVLQVLRSGDVPVSVVDFVTVTSVLPVSFGGTIMGGALQLSITHTYDSDMTISITAPGAAAIDLSSGNGSSGDDYSGTIFDSTCATPITSGTAPFAGCYAPEQSLLPLLGTSSAGNWTLSIYDSGTGDVGALTSWAIALCVQ